MKFGDSKASINVYTIIHSFFFLVEENMARKTLRESMLFC
jgi:hypothetical protein